MNSMTKEDATAWALDQMHKYGIRHPGDHIELKHLNNGLPDKKYYEFAYHKFFNPEVEYTSWEPWDAWDYPERDILRFGCIIKDQIPFIQNKKVLDGQLPLKMVVL